MRGRRSPFITSAIARKMSTYFYFGDSNINCQIGIFLIIRQIYQLYSTDFELSEDTVEIKLTFRTDIRTVAVKKTFPKLFTVHRSCSIGMVNDVNDEGCER